MSALDLSQTSLNFDLLEMQIGDVERSELNESMLESSNSECENERPELESEVVNHGHDEMEVDEPPRKSIKDRLGIKPQTTPMQDRLATRYSSPQKKRFKIKPVTFDNKSDHSNSRFFKCYANSNSNEKPNKGDRELRRIGKKSILPGKAKPLASSQSKRNYKQTTVNHMGNVKPLTGSHTAAQTSGPLKIPMPVPPPCFSVPPPTVKKTLTNYMIHLLAEDLIASCNLRYEVSLNLQDIEHGIRMARRT